MNSRATTRSTRTDSFFVGRVVMLLGKVDMSKKNPGIGSNLSNMAAAMIPGAKVNNKGRIMVNVGTSKETIVFNIGGVKFETYRSTLHRLPNSPLANEKFLKNHYRSDTKDYFFDRDPDVFRATLNYLRTGELHLPSYICGPAAKMELEFWGVVPSKIERCCWTNYNDWNSTLDALQQLDSDRRGSMLDEKISPNVERTWWNVMKPQVWNFFNNPFSSVYSKCFGIFSLFLVFLSIFSFVASTTEAFNVCNSLEIIRGNKSNLNDSHVTFGPPFSNSINETSSRINSRKLEFIKMKHDLLLYIDLICMVYFTLEYITRVLFSPHRLRFITSTMGVFDLLAILPDYIELIILAAKPELVDGCEVPFIAFARILRILRVFRLVRYVPGLWILVYTLRASIGELILLACFMSLGILLFASLIYFVDTKETFSSIPEGFWWALITMTTVGYGDMYPTTTLGKIVGSICAMTGLLMIGFSVPALVNNFMLYYKHVQYAIQAERMAEQEKTDADRSKCLNGFGSKGLNGFGRRPSYTVEGCAKDPFSKFDQRERSNDRAGISELTTPETETEVSPLVNGTNNNKDV